MFAWLPAQHLQRLPAGGLGAVQPEQWFDSGCGGGAQARWLPNGIIETQHDGQKAYSTLKLPEAVLKWAPLIQSAAAKAGVPPQLVAGIMMTESGGQPQAHSSCCYGLMGFLPATASDVAGRPVTPAELLSNTTLNVELGAKFLAQLLTKYKGNPVKVAIAYNAGSVKCGAPKKCPDAPNVWNAVTDCAQGKAVDYPGRVFAYSNDWVETMGTSVTPSTTTPLVSGFGSSFYVEVGLKVAAVLGVAYVVAPGMFPSWKKVFK